MGAFLGVLGDQGHPLGQLVALLLHGFALLPVLDGVVVERGFQFLGVGLKGAVFLLELLVVGDELIYLL